MRARLAGVRALKDLPHLCLDAIVEHGYTSRSRCSLGILGKESVHERPGTNTGPRIAALLVVLLTVGGCTTLDQWVHNGFKVGPNFQEPTAKVADRLDRSRRPAHRARPVADDAWWSTFDDPQLDALIDDWHAGKISIYARRRHVFYKVRPSVTSRPGIFSRNRRTPLATTPMLRSARISMCSAVLRRPRRVSNSTFQRPGCRTRSMFGPRVSTRHGSSISGDACAGGRIRRRRTGRVRRGLSRRHGHPARRRGHVLCTDSHLPAAARLCRTQRRDSAGNTRIVQARLKQGKATSLDVEQAKTNLGQTASVDSAAGYRHEAGGRSPVRAAGRTDP